MSILPYYLQIIVLVFLEYLILFHLILERGSWKPVLPGQFSFCSRCVCTLGLLWEFLQWWPREEPLVLRIMEGRMLAPIPKGDLYWVPTACSPMAGGGGEKGGK